MKIIEIIEEMYYMEETSIIVSIENEQINKIWKDFKIKFCQNNCNKYVIKKIK